MTDIEEITDVLVRYATGIDTRDWDLFRTCFTEDCSVDYGEIGRWQSADAITAYMRRAHSGPSMHRLSNIAVHLDGDRATARSYVDAMVLGRGGRGGANSLGYYDDRLVRTEDGWRIAERSHTGVRLTLLGPLRVIGSGLATRLAMWANRKMVK
jgi:uncharacterized protein (TIGR02246 family)